MDVSALLWLVQHPIVALAVLMAGMSCGFVAFIFGVANTLDWFAWQLHAAAVSLRKSHEANELKLTARWRLL